MTKRVYQIWKLPKGEQDKAKAKLIIEGANKREMQSLLAALRRNNKENKYWLEIKRLRNLEI